MNEGFQLECEGYGPVPAKYLFVGISAGRRGALVSRVPLTKDASGRLFQRCLRKLGLSESDEFSEAPKLKSCYVTNLVKGRCVTPEGLNRLPTPREVEFWWRVFEAEYYRVQPQKIIALGEFVWRSIWRKIHVGFMGGDQRAVGRITYVKHPRWFQAHGALSLGSEAFRQMVEEYRSSLS